MEYNEYLDNKRLTVSESGFNVEPGNINPMLFEWQRDIVRWALRRGKAALFEDCGLGKTPQQLEWARMVAEHTNKPVIIFAPLAVAAQTQREGVKFGVDVTICESQLDVTPGVNITNYEKMHHFNPDGYGGIVLDESSILKGFDGKTRKRISHFAHNIPYRLCCTATPAPNDLTELTRHAEFLEIMREKEVKALFFTQDGNSTTNWRLKGHARTEFWHWMAQWSVAIRYPSDLGYDDNGFSLPALNIIDHRLPGVTLDGYLLPVKARTLSDERKARKETIEERVKMVCDIVNDDQPALVWCDYNYESERLAASIPDAVEIKGSDSEEHKKQSMIDFTDGKIRVLVTKPSIAGFGMNWQHCNKQVFIGVSHSYERFYQAVRRSWRFGQKDDVDIHVLYSQNEGAVVENLRRKEKQAQDMYDNIVKHMAIESELNRKGRMEMVHELDIKTGKGWTLYLGDSVETIDNIEDDSLGLIVFSPPFPGMYVYTNSVRDMGNSEDVDEMVRHFGFLSRKMYKKLMPGRNCVIHLTQSTATISRDGFSGMRDFRGAVIQMMIDQGWQYYGEICIDKNPQVKAIRTKDHGLMFKSLASDSAKMHVALADYMLQFRKPGDNPVLIRAGISERYDNNDGWITSEEWIRWARPVWYADDFVPEDWYVIENTPDGFILKQNDDKYWTPPKGISETDVLNVKQARETDDERHLCPLQLGVIHRAVKLWSAPGETVYSPFAGVGSEGVESIKLGRQFIGGELKRSYFESAARNLSDAVRENNQMTLFDLGMR
jgi:DNA modification methylase